MPEWTLQGLEATYPMIHWREPAVIRVLGDDDQHFACKICIANKPLKGEQVPSLPSTPEPVLRHLREMHGA